MSVSSMVYHRIHHEVARYAAAIPEASRTRLALLIAGIVAARSCVIARMARALHELGVTDATDDSIARRLRRTMNDAQLTVDAGYEALITAALAKAIPAGSTAPIILSVDESSHSDHVHLLRIAIPYRGGTIPLAWATWPQNQQLPDGAYWTAIDRVLAEAARRLPADASVIVVADRAYAVPNFLDRVQARGWHWIVRATTTGAHRWCARIGPAATDVGVEEALADHIARVLPRPGTRWRGSGQVAKKAGWRSVQVVGHWGHSHEAPLVLLTNLPPRWTVLAQYRRRFWIEAGFRSDKSHGWNWEASQVRDEAHHQVLLLALAWATLLALCAGAAAAAAQLAQRRAAAHTRPQPRRARASLFRLGLDALQRRGAIPRCRLRWTLPAFFAPAWAHEWSAALARHYIFSAPVRP